MSNKEKVRQFLSRHVGTSDFQDDTNIFESKIVNSLFAMQLVAFIEDQFNITLDSKDLEEDYFKDINSIAALIELKQKKDCRDKNYE